MSSPRSDYLKWDEYFMAVAFLSANRSKDPSTQVGACIVNDRKIIVGIGYNGMPTGCDDKDFPWGKTAKSPLENKYLYVCHAEVNAILNKNCASIEGCTMYVALFPCNECAKFIIQSGIKTVKYMSDKDSDKPSSIAARKMFKAAGVECIKMTPLKPILINFNTIPLSPTERDNERIQVGISGEDSISEKFKNL